MSPVTFVRSQRNLSQWHIQLRCPHGSALIRQRVNDTLGNLWVFLNSAQPGRIYRVDALERSALSVQHDKFPVMATWHKKAQKKRVRDSLQKDADTADINYSVAGQSMRPCFTGHNELKHLSSPSPDWSFGVTLSDSPSVWQGLISSPTGAVLLYVPPRERGLAVLTIWGRTPQSQYHLPAPFRAPARCRARSHPSYATTALPAGISLAVPTVDHRALLFPSRDSLLTCA